MAGSEKSEGAFRTIREVADWLAVPTHVLRFWESKFNQIAPVKGAGGRRYYRPDDMRLLGGIKVMLHDQGLTVRAVTQKIDDEGATAVMALSPDLAAIDVTPNSAPREVRTKDMAAVSTSEVEEAETEDSDIVSLKRTGTPAESKAAPPNPAETGTDPAPQPDAPEDTGVPPQPRDVDIPTQPDEKIDVAPSPPQPSPDLSDESVPGADPAPVASNERGVELEPPVAVADPIAPPAPTPQESGFDRMERRQLRRILTRLRGLISQVEAEMAKGDFR